MIIGYSQSIKIEEINCKLSKNELMDVKNIIQFESEFYKEMLDINPEKLIVKIKIFGNYRRYKMYQKRISKNNSNTGFYSQKLKTAVIYKNENFIKTISHEVSHVIMRSAINPVPKWINEGFAEWFEGFYFLNNKMIINIQIKKINKVRNWIKTNKLVINDFLNLSNKQWLAMNKSPKNFSYAVSYCIIYFLQLEHPNINKKMLTEIKLGKSSKEAINNSYPGGLNKFENDFMEYYGK
ncbi:DUF1570 domain-containing protein [Winogradskyella sp. SM1960]|uniref:DUF1570 domain-containing protein n=1 Tax=Winogradskyella sp. SM1960 TaxID=2865955 RepID=UPI001CD6CEB5|nr:DUF1570 domain-containing protein [Winogradskyella sp. SM1960]